VLSVKPDQERPAERTNDELATYCGFGGKGDFAIG
jgi:hypothetical protein